MRHTNDGDKYMPTRYEMIMDAIMCGLLTIAAAGAGFLACVALGYAG